MNHIKVILALMALIALVGMASAGYGCVKDLVIVTDCCNPVTGNVFANDLLPDNYKNIRSPAPGEEVAVGNGVGTIIFEQDGSYEFFPANLAFPKKGTVNYLIEKDDGTHLTLGAYAQFEVPAGCDCDETCDLASVTITTPAEGQVFHVGDSVDVRTTTTFSSDNIRTWMELNGVPTGTGHVTFGAPGNYQIRAFAEAGDCRASDMITVTVI